MSAQLSRDDWKNRIGGLSYRNQAFIAASSLFAHRQDLRLHQPGEPARCDQGRGLRAGPTSTERGQGGARGLRKGTWPTMADGPAQAHQLKLAELMIEENRESWRC